VTAWVLCIGRIKTSNDGTLSTLDFYLSRKVEIETEEGPNKGYRMRGAVADLNAALRYATKIRAERRAFEIIAINPEYLTVLHLRKVVRTILGNWALVKE